MYKQQSKLEVKIAIIIATLCLFSIGPAASTASASIPSKYQTLVIDNSENKGFLSKTKRFNYDLWAVSSPIFAPICK